MSILSLLNRTAARVPSLFLNNPHDPTFARIAVYSVDQWSAAHDLVTALLQVPLSSENLRIRSRWQSRPPNHPLTISHESISTADPSIFKVTSPYLVQFSVPLQITEIPPSQAPNDDLIRSILQADTAIIVCNPLTTSLPDLLATGLLSYNTNLILVLSCTSSSPPLDPSTGFLSRFIPQGNVSPFQGLTILAMDPPRAVAAIEALTADPRSSTTVQRYQDDFTGSKVSTLTAVLKSRFTSGSNHIRTQTALAQIQFALAASHETIRDAKRELETLSKAVGHLKDRVEETKVRVQGDILGRQEGEVVAALDNARKELRVVMDRLSWFRMVSRVDEISYIVGQAIGKAWCQELEKQLVFHTGQLSALQNSFTKDTFALLETQHKSPLNSAVLSNSLRQIIASPSYTLTSHILTSPIHARRSQITSYPTTQLHLAGQRAVFSMGSSIAAGAGVGWAGWVGYLAGTEEGLLGMIGMDAGTAMGVGLLSAAVGVRWTIGRWEKAKRRWWEDWERVGQGLGRDLRATLDRVVRDNVVVVADRGCEQLSEFVVKRKAELEKDEGELEVLRNDLRDLVHVQQNPK